MIIDYFANKPYDLEIPHILGNCDLCFMKGQNAIMAILKISPELADKWIEDEENPTNIYGHTYFQNTTMRQLRDATLSLSVKLTISKMLNQNLIAVVLLSI